MLKSLFIPMRIEGVFLEEDSFVCSPLADFERLPWSDGNQDNNYDVPFLGDSIVNKPFSDRNCLLEKGLHLHFILPHFLGQPIPEDSGLAKAGELPAAPNYWVIIKKRGTTIEKTFYIQSDYVYTDINAKPDYSCIIPAGISIQKDPGASDSLYGRPYTYMGLQSETRLTYSESNSFQNLTGEPLTVTGYGDINFSSFYPNCKSAFGFCDKDISLESMSGDLSYEVYGWVNSKDNDVLFQYLNNNQTEAANLKDRLANLFHVAICDGKDKPLDPMPTIDGRTIFYARFICDNNQVHFKNEAPNLNIKIAIGNTGTEAMAAMLASNYSGKQKAIVEEQLEYVNLFPQLGGLIGDIGPKFLEARHTHGFNRISGGYKWAITAKGAEDEKGAAISVGDEILTALTELNKAQHKYDDEYNELISLKEQLYMDWYKYMHLAYPLPDGIDNELLERMGGFLGTVSMPEVQKKINRCGTIRLFKGDKDYEGSDCIDLVSGDEKSRAFDVFANWQTLLDKIKTAELKYNLSCIPAHHYWQPKPPVMLISGLSSDDNDEQLLKKAGNNNMEIYAGDWNFLPNTAADIANPSIPKDNTQHLSGQITNPFILEWEIDLLDTALLRDEKGEIDAKALTDCVQIMENGSDFEKTSGFKTGEYSVFSGSVIMNHSSRKAMVHKLIEIIKAHKSDYFNLKEDETQCDTFITTEDSNAFSTILQDRITNFADKSSPQYQVLLELQTLLIDHSILAQSLSGFNHACRMHGMTAQLPILDPMGFKDTWKMTQQIATIVGNMEKYSPLMGFLFNPIRSGTITLNRLNLIDNFGVVTKIKIPETTVWAETLKDGEDNPFLPPRLTQPARLHFSFLDGAKNPALGKKEFNQLIRSHNLPESSPVCGWLIPNYLDNDLMVFDKDGAALGYLNDKAQWEKPPYQTDSPSINSDISNEHLRRVVNWLLNKPKLLADFLDSIQTAQDNMAASHANTYKSQAILMGKPIAVVRAAVHFQLKGLPVINQSWSALVTDIHHSFTYDHREKDNWTNVDIPFRLGEHQQLDDGLIGYWLENSAATTDNQVISTLVAPESTNRIPNAQINTFGSNKKQQESLAINDTKIATLLLDPRSGVHCTSGIVPTVNTRIDPALFLPAMQRLEMWFKLSAVLQPTESLDKDALLNLPNIEDTDWRWYDQFNGERNMVADETDGFLLTKNTLKESFLILKNKKNKN